jgi:hypothetical protein
MTDKPLTFDVIQEAILLMEEAETFKDLDGMDKKIYVHSALREIMTGIVGYQEWETFEPFLDPLIDTFIKLSKSEIVLQLNQKVKKSCFSCLKLK